MNLKLKNLIKILAINAVLISAIIYFVIQYAREQKVDIETERTEIITKQEIIETNGYIFRNELPITSANKNNVVYISDDGDKVSKDEAVAAVNQSNNEMFMKNKIKNLEKKIDILEKSNINLDFATISLDKINKDSNEIYIDIINDIKSGNFKDTYYYGDNLLILINKKQLMTKNANNFDSMINLLNNERDTLRSSAESAINSSTSNIITPKSGYFYSSVDGYENIFNKDALSTLTFDTFNELLTRDPEQNVIDNSIGKVSYDYEWFLVCYTEKEREMDFVEGNQYDVVYSFSSNKTLKMTLYKKSEKISTNEVLLVFKTSLIPPDFDFTRKQPVRIVFSKVKGLKVPEQAIKIFNNQDGSRTVGVYILKGETVKFKILPDDECIGKFEGYYLYTEPLKRKADSEGSLQINEEIILHGKDIREGKVISY